MGSARCGECHARQLAAWSKSWHARALGRADRRAVVGDFGGRHFRGTSSAAWMKRTAAGPVMRTRGPGGELADFPVQWVIGGKRMQDAMTVMPDGRWQVLPVYYHVPDHEWVDYTEAKQGPLTPDHPFYWSNFHRMANHGCLDCHATGLSVDYDRAAVRWTTTFADAGVGCESCHGPGSAHADSQDAADIQGAPRARRDAEPEPVTASMPDATQAGGDVPDLRARFPTSTVLWIVTFLLAVVLLSRLRTLPHLFLLAAFIAWCSMPRLRRAATVAVIAVAFVCLEVFLPFDVSLIDAPGGMKIVRVLAGKPAPEAIEAARRGEVVLNGCLVRGTEPRRVLVW